MSAPAVAMQKPLRILRLEISNFMRIEGVKVDLHGKHLRISGANACLHASTPIHDPVDGSTCTVEERHRQAKPFHAWALGESGPVMALALPPIKYAAEPMVELMMAGGEAITVTMAHRFWNGADFVTAQTVCDALQQSGLCPLPSISGIALSVHGQDARHLRGKMVWQNVIGAREIPAEPYYDFHVPVHENYWACGLFHHNTGKSSVVDAIWAALGGKSAKDMPEPIHAGAERAEVRLDLGEYIVTRIWTEKSSRLEVTAADGSIIKKPGALLEGLISTYALDPLAFMRRRSQDQVDDVLAVEKVSPPTGEVLTITGESHEPMPGESAYSYLERLSADETGLYYDRRRNANRLVEQKRAALAEERRALDGLGGPLKLGERESSPGDTLKQIAALQAKDDQRKALADRAAEARKDADAAKEKLDGLAAQREREAESLTALDAQIAALNGKRDKHLEAVQVLAGRITKGNGVVAEYATEAAACQDAAGKFPDPRPEIAKLRASLETCEHQNKQLVKRQMQSDRIAVLGAEAEKADAVHRSLDSVLTKLRALRGGLLAGVDLGVPGLSVGAGELRLNWAPFSQASTAEKIRVACAVAMRQKPALRLLRVDGGEALDKGSWKLLYQIAEENDFQIISTAVSDAAGLRVEIVDSNEAAP